MNDKQLEYVVEVLEREISGYSKDYVPERISLLRECVRELKGEVTQLTDYHLQELQKCKDDIVYFAEKYVTINNVFSGAVRFNPYPHQKELLRVIQNNNYVIGKLMRQSGKTVCGIVAILHELVFGEPKTIGILSYKKEQSRQILDTIKLYYSCLPDWMTFKIVKDNKEQFQLEKGSYVDVITVRSFCGKTYDTILLDEYAFLFGGKVFLLDDKQKNSSEAVDLKGLKEYNDFWKVFLPLMTCQNDQRILILSTISSTNKNHYFNKLWLESSRANNNFVAFESNWKDYPELDEKWSSSIVKNIGEGAFSLEYECKIEEDSP